MKCGNYDHNCSFYFFLLVLMFYGLISPTLLWSNWHVKPVLQLQTKGCIHFVGHHSYPLQIVHALWDHLDKKVFQIIQTNLQVIS